MTFALPSRDVWNKAASEEVVRMDMEGFRDKADDALAQGEEEVDERTGGRFDEQTDRAAEEVRERGAAASSATSRQTRLSRRTSPSRSSIS